MTPADRWAHLRYAIFCATVAIVADCLALTAFGVFIPRMRPAFTYTLLGAILIITFLVAARAAWRLGIEPWRREDRAAQGLCPRCGYSLTANVSGVCPECGQPLQSPP